MTLGTNNKKQLYVLIGLGVVAAYFVYTNLLAGPDVPAPSRRPSAAAPVAQVAQPAIPGASAGPPPAKRAGSRARSGEFSPKFRDRNPANRPSLTDIDPTLRLDLLGKVQGVDISGGARNVFQFSAAPPAEAPKLLATAQSPVVPVKKPFVGPPTPPPPPPPPPPPGPKVCPPVALKFYGYSVPLENGKRTAYLLEGEEIYVANEGDTIKRRYKVTRILPNSIQLQDLDEACPVSAPITPEGTGD